MERSYGHGQEERFFPPAPHAAMTYSHSAQNVHLPGAGYHEAILAGYGSGPPPQALLFGQGPGPVARDGLGRPVLDYGGQDAHGPALGGRGRDVGAYEGGGSGGWGGALGLAVRARNRVTRGPPPPPPAPYPGPSQTSVEGEDVQMMEGRLTGSAQHLARNPL